jgi:DNA-binding CsgD family transcriptional regulator
MKVIGKEVSMGIRNPGREQLLRLESKTLDAQFLTSIQQGLNCSPFESYAVLEVVKEVYFPFLSQGQPAAPLPGKITLVGVCADEPPGKPIAKCIKRTLSLTVHRGAEDDRLLQKEGTDHFRQARIPDLCQEALSQGGLLTREDLAYRIFFAGTRTISRDLSALRKRDPDLAVPLRSTVQDMGPVLTHRVEIVRLALSGKTMTEICRIMRHSQPAVANYLSTFTRVAQLAARQMQASQIAFLLGRGRSLIDRYLELLTQCEQDKNFKYHLGQLIQLGQIMPPASMRGEKKRLAKEGRR